MRLFKKKTYIPLNVITSKSKKSDVKKAKKTEEPAVPDGMWVKCRHCQKLVYKKEMDQYQICPKCGGHFRIGAWERIAITCDKDTFAEFDGNMISANPMGYPNYERIIAKSQEKSGTKDAVVCGTAKIDGMDVMLAVMDSNFMMASMGSVVGEKITRAFERATQMKLPVIVFTSSGGARMQEGIISLMQMAKTSAAIRKHSDAGLLYITVAADPTTGGVSASFANLGDIILAEPKAIIGFAGRRVIEGTINEKLPKEFQTAEFQLEHGFIDKIVDRREMKTIISCLLKMHGCKGGVL